MNRQWWQKEIVYQIYPKSFNDSNGDGIGDIKGITEKLGYLSDLGVTMLWICPIYKSPMDDNGYDISDYFDLAPEFGIMEDLDELIEKASEKGIKIILDLVINHTSDEHKWFEEAIRNPESKYHDYYIFKEGEEVPNNWRSVFGGSVWEKVNGRNEYYFHAFGKKQPDLNWENEEVRKSLYDMVNYWLEKGIAGFRIDAITFIKKDLTYKSLEADGVDGLVKCTKTSRNQPGIEKFLHELKRETFNKHNCVTVAEAPGVGYDELDDFIGEDGYFSMIFDFKYADLDIASGSEWFKRVPWTVKDLRERIMASQMAIQEYGWSANFIENHDQPRSTTKYLLEQQNNKEAIKMLGAMYFLLRGTPFIYQGQELGMTNFERKSIDEFNDISSIDQYYRSIQEGLSEEEALKVINLRSRDNSRTPFPWNSSEYGGFSKVKPWLGMIENYKEINAEAQVGQDDSIYEFYKKMIDFRQNSIYSECLIYGNITAIDTENDEVIAYTRKDGNETIYCYFNFSQNKVFEPLNIKSKKVIFNNLKEVDISEDGIILKPNQALLITI
ncbi:MULTISPECIES: glycoside hydrolase family 13 protein [Clostridium]|uniref:glycoside hydrolase family 13 protein n=1 Tax=Clostridium TaxID=1485 RepID=UPI00082221EB|nr:MULTISPECIES: alpha-glucosidase [Clostridium]MBX9186295.1 alpha-glucosidase [Clostridium sp. K04]MDU7455225.1 alpha-glucosidase [Clostridium saudiense]SCJ99531.1 Oligo-1%2C6-glucosidase [uncultured Clostridium sp.]